MDAVPLQPQPVASAAHCPTHPDERVLGACARCGAFFCARDRVSVEGSDYCAACAARPDVDAMGAFRLRSWGKRDAWAWFFGLQAPVMLLDGPWMLLLGSREQMPFALAVLTRGAVYACYWWGLRFSRLALCLLPVVTSGLAFVSGGRLVTGRDVALLILAVHLYTDLRNKLFFKEELSREAFEAAWRTHQKNLPAWVGLALSGAVLLGLLLGYLEAGVHLLFSLQFSLVGLLRTSPGAQSPVRWRRVAIASLVLTGAGVVAVAVRLLLPGLAPLLR
jgi:hypothetical protein